ncbi:MAG: hypothetical protein OEN20_00020 [Gammaproteobacteria bacterium]|nr:hypothetical protein [Gammaproteobacteria bacterium]
MPTTPSPSQPEQPAVLSPVLHLFMLLIPTVANAFLLVYALLGAVLEAEQKQRWAAEALEVTLYIAGGVIAFCGLLFAVLRAAGWSTRHPLVLANLVQIAVAIVFLLAVVLLRL